MDGAGEYRTAWVSDSRLSQRVRDGRHALDRGRVVGLLARDLRPELEQRDAGVVLRLGAEIAVAEQGRARDLRVLRDLREGEVGPPHVLKDAEPIDGTGGLDSGHALQRLHERAQLRLQVAEHDRLAGVELLQERLRVILRGSCRSHVTLKRGDLRTQ